MKRTITLSSIAVLAIALLAESGALNALIMFLLMGQIPGTNYSIPPSVMLLLLGTITALILYRVTAVKILRSINVHRLAKKHLDHKARMPRRRYSQV